MAISKVEGETRIIPWMRKEAMCWLSDGLILRVLLRGVMLSLSEEKYLKIHLRLSMYGDEDESGQGQAPQSWRSSGGRARGEAASPYQKAEDVSR